jgi:hypothetical protein
MLYGGKYTCGDHPFTHTASHKDSVRNKKSPILTPDQRTNFHLSNVHCSCFLVLLFVSCSSIFFAAIWPWRPDSHCLLWTVDVEMCLTWTLWSIYLGCNFWGSNELILYSRGNSGSSIPVAVLMIAHCIIALDGFCDCTSSQIKMYLSRAQNTTDLTVKCLLTGSNRWCEKKRFECVCR